MDDTNAIKKNSPPELNLDNLRAVKVLGKGATGTVFLVHNNTTPHHQPFALKVVEKHYSNSTSTTRRARHEMSILSRLEPHPFLPHLIGSSETHDLISWAIPYCSGGDLNVLRHRQNDRVFSPSVIRFYLAEVISALEHLQDKGIVYRDLKPENILVQDTGHVTLTDFDLSRELNVPRKSCHHHNIELSGDHEEEKTNKHPRTKKRTKSSLFTYKKGSKSARVSPVSRRGPSYTFPSTNNERSNSFVGTEEYVAPEVIRGDGHEFAVDWWALGVLSYEMLYGATPFKGRNRKETFRNILFADVRFVGKPNALTDLIGRLLEKDPTRRLGFRGGASEVKEHEFFKGLRWDLLTEVSRPPFLPSRDEVMELTECGGGMGVREYFEKLKIPPSPLWSPSRDDESQDSNSVELTEF